MPHPRAPQSAKSLMLPKIRRGLGNPIKGFPNKNLSTYKRALLPAFPPEQGAFFFR